MHTMSMIREHEGTEEWLCPTCGRHMIVNWRPKFKRTVLQAGDSGVSHSGFKNDPQGGHMMSSSTHDESLHIEVERPIDESRLTPWEEWLKKTGFDDLWDRDIQ
jgi:DNA-directed RNA polymerase subunit RPC12/RpoP